MAGAGGASDWWGCAPGKERNAPDERRGVPGEACDRSGDWCTDMALCGCDSPAEMGATLGQGRTVVGGSAPELGSDPVRDDKLGKNGEGGAVVATKERGGMSGADDMMGRAGAGP